MSISVGDKIPAATVTTMTDEGPQPVNSEDFFGGRKVVLFGVPGAFTPTCHNQHLPGFVRHLDAIKAKGVDTIACLSVNDVFVLDAWAQAAGASKAVTFLADGNAELTTALGLELDASGFGMGTRSQRFSMIVDDGVVQALNIEPQAGQAEVSSADAILDNL
ncbi:MAG: peroxiredoxin [Alphaproteobacteria bacterium]|nr:peroxiredoxin [Alphaproteobacteria bacterium]